MTDWADLLESTAVLDEAAVVALNKPAGISVTGERHGTDIVRMAADAQQKLYPVHRIDKATSGLILFARDLSAHGALTRQFQQRTVDKTYLMVTRTRGLPDTGFIDLPLSQGRKNRVRVAAPRDAIRREGDTWTVPPDSVRPGRVYPSQTRFRKLWQNRHFTLLTVTPISGRRHQIRVHMAWIGHPVYGDPLFDDRPHARTALHSWRLKLNATWRDGEPTRLEAPPADDFWEPVPGIDVATVLGRVLPQRADLLTLPPHEIAVDDRPVAGNDRTGHQRQQRIERSRPILHIRPLRVGWSALLDEVTGHHHIVDHCHDIAGGVSGPRVRQRDHPAAQIKVDGLLNGTVRHQDLGIPHLLGDVGRMGQTQPVRAGAYRTGPT